MPVYDSIKEKPSTELEWLMQPGDHSPDFDERHIAAVVAAVDDLLPAERSVIEAAFFERVPYSALGIRLGVSKTHAWRLTQAAMRKLRQALELNAAVNERYGVFNTWNEAAWAVVKEVDRGDTIPSDLDELAYCAKRMAETVKNFQEPSQYLFARMANNARNYLAERSLWDPEEFHNLLVGKQRDYGRGNIEAFGLAGVSVRLNDKVERIKNLTGRLENVSNEPLVDSWTDVLGYCVIATMLHNDTFKLELG